MEAARGAQQRRGQLNARLSGAGLEDAVQLDRPSRQLLIQAAERWLLSARALIRVMRGCTHHRRSGTNPPGRRCPPVRITGAASVGSLPLELSCRYNPRPLAQALLERT